MERLLLEIQVNFFAIHCSVISSTVVGLGSHETKFFTYEAVFSECEGKQPANYTLMGHFKRDRNCDSNVDKDRTDYLITSDDLDRKHVNQLDLISNSIHSSGGNFEDTPGPDPYYRLSEQLTNMLNCYSWSHRVPWRASSYTSEWYIYNLATCGSAHLYWATRMCRQRAPYFWSVRGWTCKWWWLRRAASTPSRSVRSLLAKVSFMYYKFVSLSFDTIFNSSMNERNKVIENQLLEHIFETIYWNIESKRFAEVMTKLWFRQWFVCRCRPWNNPFWTTHSLRSPKSEHWGPGCCWLGAESSLMSRMSSPKRTTSSSDSYQPIECFWRKCICPEGDQRWPRTGSRPVCRLWKVTNSVSLGNGWSLVYLRPGISRRPTIEDHWRPAVR